VAASIQSRLIGNENLAARANIAGPGNVGITKEYQTSSGQHLEFIPMSASLWLALFSILIGLFALSGGLIPFLGPVSHIRLQFYLTFSAGVMLGAAFFHVMPDAIKQSEEPYFGWWMSLAVVGLFCIERFIAPHSHEVSEPHHHHHSNEAHHHHEHEPGHALNHSHSSEPRPAAPAVAGWMAVVGLTIHTFMNGVGLAGAVENDLGDPSGYRWVPGLAMFLAVFLHKPADALAISTVLTRKGVSRRTITWVQLGYVAMIPIGAYAFILTSGALGETLKKQLIGFALAFSAGTFIFIALSDLLPEVQFHRHDRVPLFLSLVAGVVLMGFIAYLESLGEGKEKEEVAKPVAAVSAKSGRLAASGQVGARVPMNRDMNK
jgi:zinc and cadmium transporter